MQILYFIYPFLVFYNVNSQTLNGYCKTPSGESAKCINVYDCTSIIALLRSPSRTQEQTEFISNSRCGFNSAGTPFVCCGSGFNKVVSTRDDTSDTTFTPNPSIPGRNECGRQVSNRIFNGETTELDEFPWMAVMQYLKRNGNLRISCAGSLINHKYILTAAHCVTGEVTVKVGQLINIRLGEYNTSSPGRDCIEIKGRQICNQQEINSEIEEVIPHPGYTGKNDNKHDIALVRLRRDIPYSDYIQPICLPQPTDASRVGESLIVAGWGKTEQGRDSNIKLKLQVPLSDSRSCSDIFGQIGVKISDTQICAGGEDGKDSCTGDSGGPLMRTLPNDDTRWMIEGIVSFGYRCGTPGYPGVYTKVAKYVPWIHKTVRP